MADENTFYSAPDRHEASPGIYDVLDVPLSPAVGRLGRALPTLSANDNGKGGS
ncbi:hypothetical protein NPS01_02010 [Nocardioides psychrotolerans]|uniref:Uncharacterized protein n=1 Tax=Nocardioides psychrotolerans TaxID=1005945 RepID=A0A1I3BNM7_9ACTN|nr:hypothetical protein [Nocardioides psychrotolerans]GEP36538.1 hypothetical protein NPS01_02010 [Nocardioides psychrotolerans]SFH63857.1 hypothetical protein SAMN05216561_101239 [Nocardioides psychrotolerans]